MKINECFFVQNNFICKNIKIQNCNFKFEKVILSNDHQKKIYEGESNNYYKILKIKNKYYLYYRASNNKYMIKNKFNHQYDYDVEKLCIAISDDGLNFDKIKIKKNNVIKQGDFCHNFFPNYMNNKFIAISGTQLNNQGLFLFDSENNEGIEWNKKNVIINENNILKYYKHKNHFDTHNSINFNNIDKFYYIHLRHNNFDDKRKVQLIKSYDLKTFLEPELICLNNNFNTEIYNINTEKLNQYEYFIGIPNYAKEKIIKNIDNKKFMIKNKYIKDIIISKDGIHYETFVSNIKLSNMNNDGQICPVNGFVECKNKKKLFFYFQNNVHQENHEIQCYSIPYNRFKSYYSYSLGSIQTNILKLKNINIEINSKRLSKKGFIVVELLNEEKERLNISKIIKNNSFINNVVWFNENIIDVKELNKFYLLFHIYKSQIFSFSYNIDNDINLDFIWSKGIYKRTSYNLSSTHIKPNEENIIQLIKNKDTNIWIRNNLKKFKNRDIDFLSKNLDKLTQPKNIIIGDGDDSIPSSYNKNVFINILNHKFIKNVFVQNYDKTIKHKKLKYYPIGLDLHSPKFLLDFNYKEKINYYDKIRKSKISYILDKVFSDTHLSTTHSDRIIMYNKIKNNTSYIDFLSEKLNPKEIIKKYRMYKFVLSPRGNGLDCHRTWELFLLGCIVIMKTSSLDEMWIKHELPVIILQDYDELNDICLKDKLKLWYEKYNKFTNYKLINEKFKNSYWLNQ